MLGRGRGASFGLPSEDLIFVCDAAQHQTFRQGLCHGVIPQTSFEFAECM